MEPNLNKRPFTVLAIFVSVAFFVFHLMGNAVTGYINTSSIFVWLSKLWMNPKAEMQHEFQVYLEQREQLVIRRTPFPPQEGIREITTDLPNPFTVSTDTSQSNPFTLE